MFGHLTRVYNHIDSTTCWTCDHGWAPSCLQFPAFLLPSQPLCWPRLTLWMYLVQVSNWYCFQSFQANVAVHSRFKEEQSPKIRGDFTSFIVILPRRTWLHNIRRWHSFGNRCLRVKRNKHSYSYFGQHWLQISNRKSGNLNDSVFSWGWDSRGNF